MLRDGASRKGECTLSLSGGEWWCKKFREVNWVVIVKQTRMVEGETFLIDAFSPLYNYWLILNSANF